MTTDALRPVYFLSDSTGITAETLGNTLLTQFPGNNFDRITIPFITTVEQARSVVRIIDGAAATGPAPLVFSTAVSGEIRQTLSTCQGIIVDLIGSYVEQLELALGSHASGSPAGRTAWETPRATSRGWPPSSTQWSTTTARACVRWRRPR